MNIAMVAPAPVARGYRAAKDLWPTSPLARTGVALAGLAGAAGLAGGRLVDSNDVDAYGLISALPLVYWMGVVAAVVATGLLAAAVTSGDRRVGPIIPAVWVLMLHTGPALAHAHVRFSIVYYHLGFIRLIDKTHTGNILLDARFAWPGFFGTFIASLPPMNPSVMELVMRLWPTLITGCAACLVAALARRSYPNQLLIGPLSSLIFVLFSWAGQDYFSPQSVGFLLYLSIVIVLESGPLRARGAWSSVAPILSRFATAGGDRPEARSTSTYVALLVLSFGAVVSHPLAPFFICAGLAMLGLYGRRVAWRLMILVGGAYVVWFIIAAQPWWSTQVDVLVAQFGNWSNVATTQAERGAQSTSIHVFVTRVRSVMGLTVFVLTLVLGTVMGTDRFRHLRPALPLAPLAGIPVLAAAVQSYGGEMIIRVFLFTLPMASILMARVVLTVSRRALPSVVAAMTLAVTPAYLIARFGNESFEMVTEPDWEAVEAMYAAVGPATVVVTDNSFLPWGGEARDTLVHRYSVAQISETWLRNLRFEAGLQVHEGGYQDFRILGIDDATADKVIVVFTPSQSAWIHEVEGAEPGLLDAVGRWMSTQPGVTVLYEKDGAWVLELAS
jgi:hypothetical protein